MLKTILFGGSAVDAVAANAGMALLRIFAGIGLAFGHGIGKMPPSDGFIEGVSKLGFPAPGLFAWAAGLSEFAGGICLALGLFTRVSSFFVFCTMFVAAFVNHINDGFSGQEKALLYLFIALFFAIAGSGNWGIDAFVRERSATDQ
ncbi:MAG: DoxX family protein [Acidobacteria bacterium]|nr:MAG: DoxX family protein [Acidobacteriota bacterium]REK02678.1 MAG: DoxX family protein [Acidobacteriota bacterium]REK13517.1 MAG: DoxX family protein [Acidobacteriota bacterium]REK41511.1 MAG: DoxX family protein [Acidobacteriota bacterium]